LPFGYGLFKAFVFTADCFDKKAQEIGKDPHGYKFFFHVLMGASDTFYLLGGILFAIFLIMSFYELIVSSKKGIKHG